jgi:hypothetical protein
MIEDRAFAGDMRYNTDTQMIEIYTDKWIALAPHSRDQATWDIEYVNEITKKKALDELFEGVK